MFLNYEHLSEIRKTLGAANINACKSKDLMVKELKKILGIRVFTENLNRDNYVGINAAKVHIKYFCTC